MMKNKIMKMISLIVINRIKNDYIKKCQKTLGDKEFDSKFDNN